MKLKVYRSLDRKSSLFGIRGAFLRPAAVGVVASCVIGFGVVGPLVDGLVGTVAAIALSGLAYLGVMVLQSRYSERSMDRALASHRLPRYVIVMPANLRGLMPSRRKETDNNDNENERKENMI